MLAAFALAGCVGVGEERVEVHLADVALLESHLASLSRVADGAPAGGPIALLSAAERFRWLVSPRSTMIQVSDVHEGLCDDPESFLEHLMATLVRVNRSAS